MEQKPKLRKGNGKFGGPGMKKGNDFGGDKKPGKFGPKGKTGFNKNTESGGGKRKGWEEGGGGGPPFKKQRFDDKKKGNGVKEEGNEKKNWKEMKDEKKRLKEIRQERKKPALFNVIKQSVQIWEKLREKQRDEEERAKLCQDLFKLVKGHIKSLAFGRTSCMILQSLSKHGTENMSKAILDEFREKEDMLALIKERYGHFLACVLFKHHGKTLNQSGLFLRAIEGHVQELLKHTYASHVLHHYFTHYAKYEHKVAIMLECYGPLARMNCQGIKEYSLSKVLAQCSDQNREPILKYVRQIIDTMTEKELKSNAILHLLTAEYMDNCDKKERDEFIETFKEDTVNIYQTLGGANIAIRCLWHGTPKVRKAFIKSLKGNVSKIACDEHGYLILLALFDAVDDIVIVSKVICKEIMDNINALMMNDNGKRVISYMMLHRSKRYFNQHLIDFLAQGDSNAYTKKSPEQKLIELTKDLEEEFIQAIAQNFGMWIQNNGACLVTDFILERYMDSDKLGPALEKIAICMAETPTETGIENHAVEMLCSSLLRTAEHNNKQPFPHYARLVFASALVTKLYDVGTAESWLKTNKGCFAILRICEAFHDKDYGQEVQDWVKSYPGVLENAIKQGGRTTGIRLLLKNVTGK